jgi:coenzyme F420-0:L-glutamate ligase/coenzyme F420-1:gamma-L-glutamate ligase
MTPSMSSRLLKIFALEGVGEIVLGDDLGAALGEAAIRSDSPFLEDDIVVVSQKIVSKAEGRVRSLAAIEPGEEAVSLARELEKDPRVVELILAESRRIVRATGRVLITEHHSGWICANSGIDGSNVPDDDSVVLLPEDADASARRIRAEIAAATGRRPGVIIADSFGRPWRVGQTDVAIGAAGVNTVDDWEGRHDSHGRELSVTSIAVADELASAADLVRRKDSGHPAVVIRGARGAWAEADGPGAAATIQRPNAEDLFR